jgi:large subunit ribosomal protein L21
MVADGDKITLGTPLLAGTAVKAKVIAHGRDDKVRIFKMQRRKHYRKSQGHRQHFTEIEILGIKH